MTRVLITDDHADIRKLVRMTLSMGDFEIFEAGNALNAMETVLRVRPAVVLMDIMMPGETDGLQACGVIKNDPDLADTIIIMLSARGQQRDVDAGMAAGADGYLVKPFSPLQLLKMVEGFTSGASITAGDAT